MNQSQLVDQITQGVLKSLKQRGRLEWDTSHEMGTATLNRETVAMISLDDDDGYWYVTILKPRHRRLSRRFISSFAAESAAEKELRRLKVV